MQNYPTQNILRFNDRLDVHLRQLILILFIKLQPEEALTGKEISLQHCRFISVPITFNKHSTKINSFPVTSFCEYQHLLLLTTACKRTPRLPCSWKTVFLNLKITLGLMVASLLYFRCKLDDFSLPVMYQTTDKFKPVSTSAPMSQHLMTKPSGLFSLQKLRGPTEIRILFFVVTT